MYFSKDACDGRNADDVSALNVDKVWQMKADEIARQKALEENSGRTLPTAKMLARQSQAYVVQRDSTNEKSMIAGYPFFDDRGRDTLQPVWAFPLGAFYKAWIRFAENQKEIVLRKPGVLAKY